MPEKWKGEAVNSHFKRNLLMCQYSVSFCQEEGQKSYNLYSDTIEPTLIFQVRKMLKERYLHIFGNLARGVWYQAMISLCSNMKGFVELPLLEGGTYICCPSSEEEVRLR